MSGDTECEHGFTHPHGFYINDSTYVDCPGWTHPRGMGKKAKHQHRVRHRLSQRFGWVCLYCWTPVECPTCHPGTSCPATLDHVLPTSRGGSDSWHNLVLACDRCNQAKADMFAPAFIGARQRPVGFGDNRKDTDGEAG